ncbi:transposase [Candidatus Saccharibacteria bacterium]|nr:transposase [Candidatus Saccharibacteria bacterium]
MLIEDGKGEILMAWQAYTNGIESAWAVLKHRFDGMYHNWSKKHCRA